MNDNHVDRFIDSAKRVGAEVIELDSLAESIAYISKKVSGVLLVPETPLARRRGVLLTLVSSG